MARSRKFWIQEAIKRPGSLRRYVQRKYGKKGFVTRGGRSTIKVSVLRRLAEKPGSIGRKARLALLLRRFSRSRRR
ncbi:MAG: hypothetical protein QXL98_01430 [Thermofilaceae archaeon]